ncbi:MAG: hypothetical protein ACYC35_09030 [Pirellulales bacterium]
MGPYRLEATVSTDGTLVLKGIPFRAGDRVEITVQGRGPERQGDSRYPLRGQPIYYPDPLTSVAENEWEAAQ